MKTKYAKKFSRFVLVLAVANAAALGAAPASLQSQEGPPPCYPVEKGEWSAACMFCHWFSWDIFCLKCYFNGGR